MIELTPWFDPSVKPVHPGVYRTSREIYTYSGGERVEGYTRWLDSGKWAIQCNSPESAATWVATGQQSLRWRGLATSPMKEFAS